MYLCLCLLILLLYKFWTEKNSKKTSHILWSLYFLCLAANVIKNSACVVDKILFGGTQFYDYLAIYFFQI